MLIVLWQENVISRMRKNNQRGRSKEPPLLLERREYNVRTVLKINGMACSMCESHINNVIRSEFDVKKVKASHKTGTAEIISENALDRDRLERAIAQTGYEVEAYSSEPYEKKSLFRRSEH